MPAPIKKKSRPLKPPKKDAPLVVPARLAKWILGQETEVIDITDWKFDPVMPDLVIRHQGQVFHFEFFDRGDGYSVPAGMARCHMAVASREPEARLIAVWVGDQLVDFEPRIDTPSMKFVFRIVDIREPLENDPRFSAPERRMLTQLQAVHNAQRGLFRLMLEQLDPLEHQRKFAQIAKGLGYEALLIRDDL